MLETHFIDERIDYTGEQLVSRWAGERFGASADSMVAFIGACDVKPEFMVDLDDLRAGAKIRSDEMLHFIIEHFAGEPRGPDLPTAVLRQRLLMALVAESVNRRLGEARVRREGDDLFDRDRKLTVSIATLSPVSALIHAGINVRTAGVPVPARGLADYGIDPRSFAEEILERYKREMDLAETACGKVREVR